MTESVTTNKPLLPTKPVAISEKDKDDAGLKKEREATLKDTLTEEWRQMGYSAGYGDAKNNPKRMRNEIKSFGFPRSAYEKGYLSGVRNWQKELAQIRKEELKATRDRQPHNQTRTR